MIVKINNEEITCESYEKTVTSLKLLGTKNGDIEYIGINWDVVEIGDSLDNAKTLKVKELQLAYQNWRNNGWLDSVSGFRLFLEDIDQVRYTQLKSIISDEADGTLCDIGTMTGWQQLEKTVLYDLLVRYGKDAFTAYKKLSDLTIYINYVCQTIEDVEAVTW